MMEDVVISREYFLRELEAIDEVPTLPQIAFKLIALISDENSSMKEIGDLIEDDPPLVAKILRIVNSSYYNLRKEVTNVRQAVVFLGLEELRNLVFAMSVFSTFYHIKENDYFSFTQFWKHSAATGKVAAVLSKYLKLNDNYVFIGGLLHDFGRLIFQLYFREEYVKVFEHSIEHHVTLFEAEKAELNFGHNEVGAWLAKKWNLPEQLSGILELHHQQNGDLILEDPIIPIVHVADRITNMWGVGIEVMPQLETIEDDPVWLALKLRYPQLESFPLDEMTRVFDMHLEEAEIFVDQVSRQLNAAEGGKE